MSRRRFDDVASLYDFFNDLFSFGGHRLWRRKIISDLDKDSSWAALDVCTGTAQCAIALAKRYPKARVVGLDLCVPMLDKARVNIKAKALDSRITLCQADALHMPFLDHSFDVVLNSFGLRNQAVFSDAIKEMTRVLKPGGQLRILEFSLPNISILKSLYLFYLEKVMPALSGWLGGSQSAYTYLSKSICSFITREQVKDLFKIYGLVGVGHQDLWAGTVCYYYGVKPI